MSEIRQLLETMKVNCRLINNNIAMLDMHDLPKELQQEIHRLNQDIGAVGLKCMLLEKKVKYGEYDDK